MSYLDGTQITAGAQLITGQVNFDTDSSNNLSGGGGHNAMPLSPGASFFITHALNEQWHVGFANYGDFGLGIDYSDDWAGRYYLQNGTLLGLTLIPACRSRPMSSGHLASACALCTASAKASWRWITTRWV